MVTRAVCSMVVAAVAVTAPAVAAADSAKLPQARAAIQGVKYKEAQALLVDALQDGDNSPRAVAEIYQLSASTAVVLGQRELAEQYYRRWLALDPSASLPEELAPKLRDPFVAAAAYMNAHGRLTVTVTRTSATSVDVVVERDPLAMVAGVMIAGDPRTPGVPGADHRVSLAVPAGATGAIVAVVDERRNRLLEVAVPAAPARQDPSDPRDDPRPPIATTRVRVPVYRRGVTWLIATGVVAGGGAVAGVLARSASSDVGALATDSIHHQFADYQAARDRRDRYAAIANGLFITSGLLAATAIVMYATAPRGRDTVIAPTVSGSSAGVEISGAF
jgi:tetratricopeptide (TPR) repeat protein